MPLNLTLLPDSYAVARLAPDAPPPDWARGAFTSITRTADELSVVAPASEVPGGVRAEHAFRVLRFEGPFAFTEIGILSSVAAPLAEAGVSIIAISTFDTDYVLVKETDLMRARAALEARGHTITI